MKPIKEIKPLSGKQADAFAKAMMLKEAQASCELDDCTCCEDIKDYSPQTKSEIQTSDRDELVSNLEKSDRSNKVKTEDTRVRLNDVIGVFKNRRKFHIKKDVRDKIINYFLNECPKQENKK